MRKNKVPYFASFPQYLAHDDQDGDNGDYIVDIDDDDADVDSYVVDNDDGDDDDFSGEH